MTIQPFRIDQRMILFLGRLVSDIAEVDYVGTALTFQMCIGFLLTIFSINLIPIILRIIGWEWIFTILAIGPILGIGFMFKYRRYEITNEKV